MVYRAWSRIVTIVYVLEATGRRASPPDNNKLAACRGDGHGASRHAGRHGLTHSLTYGLTASRIATLRVRIPRQERNAALILVPGRHARLPSRPGRHMPGRSGEQ